MMRWLYRQPDHFIPVSHWISEGIGELGIGEDKRTVVYDGIALEELDLHADGAQFRRAHGIPDDAFAVGLVGLLIPWKGQNLFLDAAKVLANEIPGLRMLIIGGTPDECQSYERELRERVIREGLQNLVVFTGHVQDMPAVYNALDVVVSASTSPEPLGTVVIETMAMGAVLIAPDHGGAAEMADHDRTALLFRPGDPPDLARMIQRIYREPELGARLGAAAREHALKTFAVETHVQGVQAVYRHVLARTSRS
jgi:glycosyltransferase involved in cell wall biosynthesis